MYQYCMYTLLYVGVFYIFFEVAVRFILSKLASNHV